METISVCKDCHERKPACWSSCQRYIEAKEALLVRKRAVKKQLYDGARMNAVQYNGLRKARKRR